MADVRGSCLCGTVAWETRAPLDFMSHCHCSRCRKSHGAAFATFVMAPADAFRLLQGGGAVVRYAASAAGFRQFCGRCGAVVASGDAQQGLVPIPAGALDDDPGARPIAHIFVASKAPWFEIADPLPRFDAYPPGVDAEVLPDLPPRGASGTSGSCLCGAVAFAFEGTPVRAQHCHCSRCRKARGAAFGSNLFVAADCFRFTRGEESLGSYRVPEARYFAQIFCRTCGSPMPRVDRERNLAVVPLGALDGDAPLRPQRHIFVESKAPWYTITDGLPQFPELPPQ